MTIEHSMNWRQLNDNWRQLSINSLNDMLFNWRQLNVHIQLTPIDVQMNPMIANWRQLASIEFQLNVIFFD